MSGLRPKNINLERERTSFCFFRVIDESKRAYESLRREWTLSDLRRRFIQRFTRQGFQLAQPHLVSSGIDPTVIFVGSNISALKKYILSGVPRDGLVIDQPSMRFRELKLLFDQSYKPNYGAFFNEIGAVAPYVQPERLVEICKNYLTSDLGIQENEILIRVSKKDEDLVCIAKNSFDNIEVDSMPCGYYRHTIGEPGFEGRNFNIAIRNRTTGSFEDIGNFLTFKRDGNPAFLEVALGDTVILRSMLGLDHVLDSYIVAKPSGLNRIESLNYINAVIVVTVLYREGLRASNRNNREKILSKYLRYLFLIQEIKCLSKEEIAVSISSFERHYYHHISNVFELVIFDISRKRNYYLKTLYKYLS